MNRLALSVLLALVPLLSAGGLGNVSVGDGSASLPVGDQPVGPRLGGPAPFPTAGVLAHYDVAEDPGADNDAATISDLVGSRDFSAATGTITLQIDAVSGERWWECDGADRYATSVSALTQPKTFCGVFGPMSTASAQIPWDAASGNRQYVYITSGGSGTITTAADSAFIGSFKNSAGRWHVMCGYYDGASSRWRVGGTEATGNPGSLFSGGFSLCGRGIGTNLWTGRIKEAAVWNGDVVADAEAYFTDKYGALLFPMCTGIGRDDCPLTAQTVTCAGDSITLGTPYVTTPYPTVLGTTLGVGWTVTNRGVGGSTVDTGITNWEITYRHDLDHWLVIRYGVNDIAATAESGASIYADITSLVADAHTYGMKVVVGTVSPWKNGSGWTAGGQTATDDLNALIVANGAGAEGVCDDYALLEDPGVPDTLLAANDSGDHLHPSDAGMAIIAGCVYAAMGSP